MPKKLYTYCPFCKADMEMKVKEIRNGAEIKKNSCTNTSCLGDLGRPFVQWNNPIQVAIVIIPTIVGLVLIKRKYNPGKGKIALPGGFVDEGETPEEAAVREAKEEVGLDIQIERTLMERMSRTVNQYIHVFVAKPVTEKPVAGDDADGAFDCASNAVPFDDLAFNVHRAALEKWIQQSITL